MVLFRFGLGFFSPFFFPFFIVEKSLQISGVFCREGCISQEGLPPLKHLLDSYIFFLKVSLSLLTVRVGIKA